MAGPLVLSGAELTAVRGREAARTALAEDGYVLVEDVLERPELDLLRAETAAHLSRVHDGTAEPLVREEDGVPFRVENIAAYPIRNRCVLASRTHPVLLDAMASLIGPDVISYGSVLVFKLAQVGPAVAMHADIAEGVFSAGHLWYAAGIYLDDAAAENGCLWVVPRSHLLSGAELAAVSAQGLDADGAVPVPARAGSVLLHDSRVLHGSRASAGGGLRRVLYHSYQGAQWLLDEGLKRSFRPDQAWIAESFRLMEWGLAIRAELGYGAGAAWQIPAEWRAPAAAVEPRDDLALIRYRRSDTR
jgi:phytanoyl-CoA hydroxylase